MRIIRRQVLRDLHHHPIYKVGMHHRILNPHPETSSYCKKVHMVQSLLGRVVCQEVVRMGRNMTGGAMGQDPVVISEMMTVSWSNADEIA